MNLIKMFYVLWVLYSINYYYKMNDVDDVDILMLLDVFKYFK